MYGWKNLLDEDRRAILEGIRTGEASGGPFHAEFDLIDSCNCQCIFCSYRHCMNGKSFPWEILKSLVKDLCRDGLRSVRIYGGGEPSMYPHFADFCALLGDNGIVLEDLTTNGILLGDLLPSLLNLKIDHVMLSLNYSNPEDHSRFMRSPRGSFQRVIHNIQSLADGLESRGNRQETLIHIHFFLHKSTVSHFTEMLDLSRKMPVDLVTIRSIGEIPEEEQIQPWQIKPLLRTIQREVKALPIGFPLELDLSSIGEQTFSDNLLAAHRRIQVDQIAPLRSISYCYTPWYNMTILPGGETFPCCFLDHTPGILSCGNAFEKPVQDIWNGKEFQRTRYEHRLSYIMEQKTPFQARRFRKTLPCCWNSGSCPLSYLMADPDFYMAAQDILHKLRNRPMTSLLRRLNRWSRPVIEGVKKCL
ncbi:radical SAM protein [Candidatus Sumerlaeota bacterium]|nr:radical SAM protein [Candidatus Sumerlaeota bacterium]